MKTTYTTDGDVRGECGHAHQTSATATQCLMRDQRGCDLQGGYSDRRITAVEDGTSRRLDDGERETYLRIEHEAAR